LKQRSVFLWSLVRLKQLIFIRHAQTDMAGTFCGRSDPELNEFGHMQLAPLISKLSGYPIRRVYTSDLRRARQTAEAIANYFHAEICLRKGLREIDFGLWDGLPWEEIESRDPVNARRWIKSYSEFTPPEGETFTAFQHRVRVEIKFLLDEAPGPCVVVVTHAGFTRVVLTLLCGLSEVDALERTPESAGLLVLGEKEIRRNLMR
jgi:alpha-ribazole phosphatase/probable phosphoglycerate mutase